MRKPLVPDGDFGPKTEAMVKGFQRLNRLKMNGIVGPVTRLHLFPWVEIDGKLSGKGKFGSPAVGRAPGPIRAIRRRKLVADDQKDEQRALCPCGQLVFTVEAWSETGPSETYRIAMHGRYSHAEPYVRRLLVAAGLQPTITAAELRMESGAPVVGLAVSARKPA